MATFEAAMAAVSDKSETPSFLVVFITILPLAAMLLKAGASLGPVSLLHGEPERYVSTISVKIKWVCDD
jgi:hypothetical protein